MLRTLRIKNLALVVDLSLDLQPGLNVITGETGAGKSILIGALNLLLGERADRTLIRSGSEHCTVEAAFDASKLQPGFAEFLSENGLEPCEEGQLVLKRSFTTAGTNRQFINGSPAPLQTLGRLGEWLVDIHGPHDHQSLLHPAPQLAILDAFGSLRETREAFSALVRRRQSLEAEKAALIVDEKTYAQQLDLLRFQLREIQEAKIQPEEESALEQEYQRSANAARLLELIQAAQGVLSEDETALLTQAGALGRVLQELAKLDAGSSGLASSHEQAVGLWQELQGELSRYADHVEVEPGRLRELGERVNLLHSLKRKYGSTLPEVLAAGEDIRKKLESLEQRDEELGRLNAALSALQNEILAAGLSLSNRRRKLIPQLAKAVTKQLSALGFRQSQFDIAFNTVQAVPDAGPALSGFDSVDFQFAPNPGEPPRPLRAIASSGEMARVMFAQERVGRRGRDPSARVR